jgi:NTE family protein
MSPEPYPGHGHTYREPRRKTLGTSQEPGADATKRASLTPVDSPELAFTPGAGPQGLVRPCGDSRRPADPGRVTGRPTFAVALSGGGFRATLAALGILRFLADTGILGDVRFVSSVSGGSIANGVLARRWADLRAAGFTTEAADRLVINPIVRSISTSSLKLQLVKGLWRTAGRDTRTDLLARALDRRFFNGTRLEDLDPGCRFIINAANLVTGVRFAFERDVLGDYVTGLAPTAGTGVLLSTAVAASAAVPGPFPPLAVRGISFPCPQGEVPELVDGGTYDNTGLQALDGKAYRDVFLVVMNAGGIFVTGRVKGAPFVRTLMRANSLLYRQSTALRTRWIVDQFRAGESLPAAERPASARTGVLMGLASSFSGDAVDAWRKQHPEIRTWKEKDLAFVPTVFDKLDEELCRLLVYRGWWLAGASFARYHPGLVTLPTTAPPLR